MGDDCSNPRVMAASLTSQLLADPGVLAAFSHELNSMIGKSSGYIESLPKSVKRRIRALKKLQVKQFQLESEFYCQVHELECKYAALYGPLHKKRQEIVNAILEPSESDCEWESEDEEPDESEMSEVNGSVKNDAPVASKNSRTDVDGEDTAADELTKGIPEFWLTVLKNTSEFSDLIKEYDEDALKCLQDVRANCRSEPDKDFQVEFVFGPNDYFTNEVLTKTYIMRSTPNPDKPLSYDGPEIIRCEGCVINWKHDKNITEKKMKEKQSGKKFITKTVKVDSFFNFFSTSPVSKDDVEDDEVLSSLIADFELGQLLRERIVPRAVLYFTGDALDNDSESEEDENENENDNPSEKHRNDDSDEDSDPDYVPPKLWNAEANNKLHNVEPTVKGAKPYHLPRRDECIIHRLRIGHTLFTRGFNLRNEDPPECIACQMPLTNMKEGPPSCNQQ